mmetsp:Transcript_58583/g.130947  ORF Transcript_58583/g.130947 Transcript_58583/m.130947 type:complete len:148 (-) Transcript_58583:336-779(-)
MGSEVDGDEDESLFDALANNPVLNALRRYKETAGTSYMTSSVLEPISETSVVNLNDPYHSAKADWERQLRAHLVNEGGFDQGSEMNNRGDFPFQIQCGNFTRTSQGEWFLATRIAFLLMICGWQSTCTYVGKRCGPCAMKLSLETLT